MAFQFGSPMKLTHQKSHRRRSPPSRGSVFADGRSSTRGTVEKCVRVFSPPPVHTPSRYSVHISTPSSLVLVCDRRRQTSFDVWITWFHS